MQTKVPADAGHAREQLAWKHAKRRAMFLLIPVRLVLASGTFLMIMVRSDERRIERATKEARRSWKLQLT